MVSSLPLYDSRIVSVVQRQLLNAQLSLGYFVYTPSFGNVTG
jgi:hypothetical protein